MGNNLDITNLDITKSYLFERNPEAQTYNIPRYNEQMSTRDKRQMRAIAVASYRH